MSSENSGLRILIVDDTQKNIQVLGTILRNGKYQLNVAQDGRQALEVLEKVTPDLILLDIMMPVLDGFETCVELKKNPDTRQIPVIFLTAKTETDDIVKGFELGAVDYITKPFNATELLVRVRTHLRIHILQRALEKHVDEIARLKREQEAFLHNELNNRITPIMGFSDMLSESDVTMFSADQRKWVEKITTGIDDLAAVTEELKRIQDFEAGRYDLDRSPCELAEVVAESVREIEGIYGGLASIQFSKTDQPVMVTVDPELIQGVFTNLIKTAVELVAEQSAEADQTVRVVLDAQGGSAIVAVNNGGPPIPQDRLARFFEKFATPGAKSSSGLGASYAHIVTTAHGGRISVTSDETDGTTVVVMLPLS